MTDTFDAIDLSSANGPDPDFARVKRAGVDVVYLRETDGVRWEDGAFERRAAQVLVAGLDLGAYHFLRVRHGEPQDAAEQVRAYHAIATRVGVTMPPALDCEPVPQPFDGHNLATGAEWRAAVLEALDEAERCFGVRPFVYTYPGFWDGKAELHDPVFATYPLWIAHYAPVVEPLIPRPWAKGAWTGWQYAAGAGVHGRVDGVVGDVDRSRFKGRVEDYRLSSA